MEKSEVLYMIGTLILGLSILSIIFGIKVSFYIIIAILGFNLIMLSMNIISGLLTLQMNKTLVRAQSKQQAESYVEMAYYAREYKERLERGQDEDLVWIN